MAAAIQRRLVVAVKGQVGRPVAALHQLTTTRIQRLIVGRLEDCVGSIVVAAAAATAVLALPAAAAAILALPAAACRHYQGRHGVVVLLLARRRTTTAASHLEQPVVGTKEFLENNEDLTNEKRCDL